MNNYTRTALCINIVAATLHITSYADNDHNDNNDTNHGDSKHHSGLKDALWGDVFYNEDPDKKNR